MTDMEITITVEKPTSWWSRLIHGRSFERVTFSGGGTDWHDVRTGRRPGTRIEARLSDAEWKLTRDESQS